MRCLVTMAPVEVQTEQQAHQVWTAIYDSFRTLVRLEAEGEIVGGCVHGSRCLQFIIEVDTLDDVDTFAMSLPLWDFARTTTTPLVNFSKRMADYEGMLDDDSSVG